MKTSHRAYHIAFMGLLFALAIALSVLEGQLSFFGPMPGIKLGLSNIAVMYCVFVLGASPAFILAVMKALFVLFTRGPVAAGLSVCGGCLSVCAMLLLIRQKRLEAGYALVSMTGAVAHNMGQLALAAILLGTGRAMIYYAPALFASGVWMGLLTAALLRVLLPYIKRLDRR